jgi:hypothetical protein
MEKFEMTEGMVTGQEDSLGDLVEMEFMETQINTVFSGG